MFSRDEDSLKYLLRGSDGGGLPKLELTVNSHHSQDFKNKENENNEGSDDDDGGGGGGGGGRAKTL